MKVFAGITGAIMILLTLVVGGAMLFIAAESNAAAVGTDGGHGLQGVPQEFREWILRADAECPDPEITPALLAAQLYQESKFKTSRDEATSHAGAQGPAQFMPDTWTSWGRDSDGNGQNSPWDIGDAVIAQGRMMCSLIQTAKRSGYSGDVRALALAGYNAGWGWVDEYDGVPPRSFAGGETYDYVQAILASIPRFEGQGRLQVSGKGNGPDALRRAGTRLGTPYSWGGGSPAGPTTGFCDGVNGYLNGSCSASRTAGFDCSSLVQYAYWPSTQLPRTAAPQFGATSSRPVARADLKPGDLLFWSHGSAESIYHVALYAGDGNVLHAPRTGKNVEVVPLANAMPEGDYFGATRP
ncbi:NlpC/P60 family protein [Streptomyces sp. Isolate_45]|uniref:C40 family peptidase n=1 Tax=Streptomyces sp. Isolate_45 TaxID=2950111 RepID=UPI00248202B9|nr:NlpC/P60 family protein [Streptomyces sp. Isolate_45]MDA5279880.1 NlpC/P60 family protein [Streptomyces sp. Isolate_45]